MYVYIYSHTLFLKYQLQYLPAPLFISYFVIAVSVMGLYEIELFVLSPSDLNKSQLCIYHIFLQNRFYCFIHFTQ